MTVCCASATVQELELIHSRYYSGYSAAIQLRSTSSRLRRRRPRQLVGKRTSLRVVTKAYYFLVCSRVNVCTCLRWRNFYLHRSRLIKHTWINMNPLVSYSLILFKLFMYMFCHVLLKSVPSRFNVMWRCRSVSLRICLQFIALQCIRELCFGHLRKIKQSSR